MLPDADQPSAQLVLRQSGSRGRRFELARLLGDRLLDREIGLRLASSNSTWRQKYQRAFAAELLVKTQRINHGLEDRQVLAA